MSHEYHYRGSNDEDEVIIQVINNKKTPLSIRITESDNEVEMVMLNLPFEEIDRMIAGLKAAKKKIQTSTRSE